MGLWVESGCLAKEKGISGRETKYARMWIGKSVLLLENYDLLRLEVSPRQEGACIHAVAHILKLLDRVVKATLGCIFCFGG